MSYPATMFVKPAKGVEIRDPETQQYLPPEGSAVPRTPFWIRRVKAKDVQIEEGQTHMAEAESRPKAVKRPKADAKNKKNVEAVAPSDVQETAIIQDDAGQTEENA